MKRNLIQQAVAAVVLALGLNAGVSQAAPITYTYNGSVSDWYADWTATGNAGGGYIWTDTSVTDRIRVKGNNGAPTADIWAGAQWVAPDGQNITSVTLTYGGIINDAGAPTLTVYAGTSSADLAPVFTNTSKLIWGENTVTLPFSPTNQYRYLVVRNWDFSVHGQSSISSDWVSDLTTISITVPEPVSLSLLALGGVVLFRRRRE